MLLEGGALQSRSRLAAETGVGFELRGFLGHSLRSPATEPVLHDPECGQRAMVATESVGPLGQTASPP